MQKVQIYADGGCSGNPGIGGWGTILVYVDTDGIIHEKELCGWEETTTNNRMELTAVIEGLKHLKKPCEILITSDSRYVVDAIEKHWVWGWQAKNWIKSGKQVPNSDLWIDLLRMMAPHRTSFVWIQGHNGHPYNERCDKLAVKAYQEKIEKK